MRARPLAGAALALAALTALARLTGFGRVAVLGRTLGTSCLGDTYQAANYLPNVLFDLLAGGALASLVVPVLAGAAAAGDRETASRTASALLTWAVAVLTPVTLLAMLCAPLLMRAVAGSSPCSPAEQQVGARLLVVFLPQIVLYGVGVVLTGVLQAHRRFLGPALAPLLSSLVVIGAYLLYAAQGRTGLAGLTRAQELTLSGGTTLGVLVLSLSLLVPLRACGLALRPSLRFPVGVAPRLRRLALAGAAGLGAQQVALVVAVRLANEGAEGSVVVFQFATTLFLLPWAVLAVPIATSVFPGLAAAGDARRDADYAALASRSLHAVLVVSLGAAAVLVAVARPAARVLVQGVQGPDRVAELAGATQAFAPGLVGYALLALLSRALYARGDGRTPAVATLVGWAVVAAADLTLVAALPRVGRVAALGLGNSIGMTVAGALLLVGLHRSAGAAALTGAGRAAAAGLTGAGVALALTARLPHPSGLSLWSSLSGGVAVAAVVLLVYGAVVWLLDPRGVAALARA